MRITRTSIFAQIRGLLRCVNALLEHRYAPLILTIILGGVYVGAFLGHDLNPRGTPPAERIGWWSWADQYRALNAAESIARGEITPEVYGYPIGYSVIGAIFLPLWPSQPFLIPNTLVVVLTGLVWWGWARSWFAGGPALVIAITILCTHGDLLRLTMVIPWNTVVTQATLLTSLWLLMTRRDGRAVILLSALAAITYVVRPADASSLAPILIWSVLRLESWRAKILYGSSGLLVVGAAYGAIGLLNLHVFDSWQTNYDRSSAAIGFFSYPTLPKLYWLLLDARPFFGESDTALLWRFPWLWLALPGAAFWVRREGGAAVAGLLAIGLNALVYVGYNDFFPSAVFRYSLVHYLSWMFLPLSLCAAAAVASMRTDRVMRWAMVGTGALAFAAAGLRLEPEVLNTSVSPGRVDELPSADLLWVEFPGAPIEDAYQLEVDGRRPNEAADFQLPYTPSDLKVLLADHFAGQTLTVSAGASASAVVPRVGTYRWGWAPPWSDRADAEPFN